MRFRFRPFAQVAVLAALSVLLLFVLQWERPGAWFQSPLSPVRPSDLVVPGIPPVHKAASPVEARPTSMPPDSVSQPLAASAWSSPLPWIGVGLVVFGAFTWALYSVLRRLDSGTE